MSVERCYHGINVAAEPCYDCDLYDQPPQPEPDRDEYCAIKGHQIYGTQRFDDGSMVDRCWCGYRAEHVREASE